MTVAIPFVREIEFEYGRVDRVSPLIRRVVARNPSPFTFHGTGTYIVGRGRVAVIDPGPDLAEHIDALADALDGEEVDHILVTHTHADHSPASRPFQRLKGGTVGGFSRHHGDGGDGAVKVEEGGDFDFVPDVALGDGSVVAGNGWTLDCVHTPGHMSNHLCFHLREERALFTGDHVMGWSTSVIIPPDGHMGDYIANLERLLDRDDAIYWPTHGPPVRDPKPFVRALVAHRYHRAEQIVDCLRRGPATVEDMVAAIYADLPARLHGAAARSTLAALIMLVETGRASCDGAADLNARYTLAA